MISKMKFINIVGELSEFERIVSDYVMEYEIQLENPMSALKNTAGFVPNTDENPYEDIMKRFIEVFEHYKIEYSNVKKHSDNFTKEELFEIIDTFDTKIHALKDRIEKLEGEIEEFKKIEETHAPVMGSDVKLEKLGHLEFLKFRFGRMPISTYQKLDTYLKDKPVYFEVMTTDKEYVWGMYFVDKVNKEAVDRMFAALYFERFMLEIDEEGTPAEIVERMRCEAEEKQAEIDRLRLQMDSTIKVQKEDLLKAFADIKYRHKLFSVKRYMTNTNDSFCITGWVTDKEADNLIKKSENDSSCMIVSDNPEAVSHITPPTKFRNLKIFKPFEEFVRMYGVPNYNELDPTPFFAVVYTLLFGIMFGDVGHGLCLAAIGLIMTLTKKGGFLGKILVPIGLSSTVFGFVYGSFFGLEGEHGLIKPIWFTPFETSTTMMNTLIYSIILGVVLILICMVINIINGVKQKNPEKIFFSQNGVAGLVFYVLVLYCALSAVLGTSNPLGVAVVMIVVSLILIFMREPLGKLVAKKKDWMPKEKGGFFVEAFFETFEIVLSFVTNTVSFLRVGAFALNHAGMMSVVVMFMYKLSTGGSIAVTVFGNILVIGLEGLIVGIQVLRLGFYEMFGRFYSGDGQEFKPFNKK